jgi:uncharacterized protein YpuA (DUF1002 family)
VFPEYRREAILKLSIEKCKKNLQQSGVNYTDEQVKQLRQVIYKMANLDYHLFSTIKTKKDANSNHLHQSVD